MNSEGEYWTFTAECLRDNAKCELDPTVCLDCEDCELTLVDDVLTFTPDFKVKGGE